MIKFYKIVIGAVVIISLIAALMSAARGDFQYIPLYAILIAIALGIKKLVIKIFKPSDKQKAGKKK